MKTNILLRIIATIGLLISVIPISADNQDVPDSLSTQKIGNNLEGWTDEQFRHYEDSIRKSIYGTFTILSVDSAFQIVDKKVPTDSTADVPDYSDPQEGYRYDSSRAVGEIPIYSGTTPTGAKTYVVPISVPEGMNHHTPQLSLTYNSQMGNSVVGMGWSLSGISFINRGVKSFYYDGKAEGTVMNLTDPLYLNGIRLIRISGSSSYIQYRSETGNIRVKGYVSGNVFKYFDVYYPEGKQARFGFTDNTLNKVAYPITSLKDLHGNEITYTYIYSHNNYNISTIAYNGASIEFDYEDSRIDTIMYYVSGVKVIEPHLLNQISCKIGNQVLGTYTIVNDVTNYSYRSTIIKRIEYASGSNSLNALRFYYGKNLHNIAFNSHYTVLGQYFDYNRNLKVVRGKLEHDSNNDDVIVFPEVTPYYVYNSFGQTWIANLNPSNDTIFVYSHLQGSQTNPLILTKGSGFIDFITADLNGRLKDKAIKINNYVYGNSDRVEFKVYTSESYADFIEYFTRTFDFQTLHTSGNGTKSVQPKYYYTGDFNGDGKMEVLAVSAHQPLNDTSLPTKCYVFDLLGNQICYEGAPFVFNKHLCGQDYYSPQLAEANSDKIFIIDYDGDGKSDICHIHANGASVYTFDIEDGAWTLRQVGTTADLTRSLLSDRVLFPGDYNGDHQTDFILTAPENASETTPALRFNSKGDGVFEKSLHFNIPKNNNTGYFVQDINGDGLTDVVRYNTEIFRLMMGRNNSLYYYDDVYGTFCLPCPHFIPVDFNSRQSIATLLCLSGPLITTYTLPLNLRKELMLTRLENSYGVLEENEYSVLNEQQVLPVDTLGTIGYGINFPYVEADKAPPVLTRTEIRRGNAVQDSCRYYYQGCTLHLQGLGFRGFQKTSTRDSRGNYTFCSYSPLQFGTLMRKTECGKDDNLYSYTVNVQSNKIASILLNSRVHEDYLKNLSDTTTYTYDSNGYPLTERTAFSDGHVSGKQTTYYNSATLGKYYLGYPKRQTSYIQRQGKDIYRERREVVSHSFCNPLEVRRSVNNHQCGQELYTYDIYGNLTSSALRQVITTDTLPTTYAYDTFGRLIQKTDPLGLTTSYTYDNCGRLSTETDFRGGVTTHTYDDFGREVSVTYPDSTVLTNTLSWATEGTNGVYAITRTQTGAPTTQTIYDAFNREVRSSTRRIDGDYLKTDRLYDDRGRLWKVSLPFKENNQIQWNVYSYDGHDRLISVVEPSERITTYSYNGTSKTTTEDGIPTTRTYDSLGGLISVTDPGGTITYDLDSDGQPSSITAPGNIVTSFTYDTRRRQTSMTDPSAGTTNYTYKGFSHLIKTETDANGKTKTFSYDKYGRHTSTHLPEYNYYNITYQYNSLNELTSVTRSFGPKRYFTYDTHGRLKTEKEKLDSDWLLKEYFYSNGKTDSIQYSTQAGALATQSFVYSYGNFRGGYLKSPSNQSAGYSISQENGMGQVAKATSGPLTREYEYDTYGYPNTRKAKVSTLNYKQNILYHFEPSISSLDYRRDEINHRSEEFAFDNLNRLTEAGISLTSYDTKGNIIQKSDVGTFSYNTPQKPYAISNATFLADSLMPMPHDVRYTSFNRPDSIIQDNATAVFTYNDLYDRVKMQTTVNSGAGNTTITDLYFGGCYEKHTEGNATPIERLYLFGDYYNAPAVLIKQGNTYTVNYILRDYQGSITHVLASDGTVLQELSYDAWGRLRNPSTLRKYLPGEEPTLLLGRGYTGHEHLQRFGLINMNARLYNPMVSRFLSPDPYVQMPDNTQNFNRYSYCLNNPLKYIDENGEFIFIDDFLIGMLRGWEEGKNVIESGWNQVVNCAKIWGGLFALDNNKDFVGKTWEFISRFTWQLPQTFCGITWSHCVNSFWTILDIDYLYGTTVIRSTIGNTTRTVTLGNYIVGSPNLKADPHNKTFQHEYGHYIQSQNMGLLYLLAIGIPSITSASENPERHKYQPFERDANYLAFKYFNKNVNGFYQTLDEYKSIKYTRQSQGWNFETYPLLPTGQYIDYYKISDHYKVMDSLPTFYVYLHF